MITDAQINNWFTYHSPQETADALGCKPEDLQGRYIAIREAGRAFVEAIVANTGPCADQTAAIRKVREAVMTANASIACLGK